MRTFPKCLMALAAAGLWASTSASAALVYDTTAAGELTGSRTITDILLGGPDQPTSFTLSWVITAPTATTWHYEYTVTWSGNVAPPPPTAQNVSHLILDLSDDCTTTSRCAYDASIGGSPVSPLIDTYVNDSANPGMLGTIIGGKFDCTGTCGGDADPRSFLLSFDSVRAPVYGDFYMKSGNPAATQNATGWTAQNSGIDRHNTSENILDFVARPDGAVVPEPGGIALLGLGLIALGIARRRYA